MPWYWHISMPRFPRCMRPSYTNHNVTNNLEISNPYAGIEPAEREARTNTVGNSSLDLPYFTPRTLAPAAKTGICQCHDSPKIQQMSRTKGECNHGVRTYIMSWPTLAQTERQHTCDGRSQNRMINRWIRVQVHYFSLTHENLQA